MKHNTIWRALLWCSKLLHGVRLLQLYRPRSMHAWYTKVLVYGICTEAPPLYPSRLYSSVFWRTLWKSYRETKNLHGTVQTKIQLHNREEAYSRYSASPVIVFICSFNCLLQRMTGPLFFICHGSAIVYVFSTQYFNPCNNSIIYMYVYYLHCSKERV